RLACRTLSAILGTTQAPSNHRISRGNSKKCSRQSAAQIPNRVEEVDRTDLVHGTGLEKNVNKNKSVSGNIVPHEPARAGAEHSADSLGNVVADACTPAPDVGTAGRPGFLSRTRDLARRACRLRRLRHSSVDPSTVQRLARIY